MLQNIQFSHQFFKSINHSFSLWQIETRQKSVIDEYSIGITARQWGRLRKTISRDLLSAVAYKNDGANGEKETLLIYIS